MSEPLGISGRAFATFPECELATEWRFQTIFPTYQEFNMATGKPEVLWNQYKLSLLVLQLKIKCQRLPPHFDYVRQRRHCPTSDDIRNPKIRHENQKRKWLLGYLHFRFRGRHFEFQMSAAVISENVGIIAGTALPALYVQSHFHCAAWANRRTYMSKGIG